MEALIEKKLPFSEALLTSPGGWVDYQIQKGSGHTVWFPHGFAPDLVWLLPIFYAHDGLGNVRPQGAICKNSYTPPHI